MTSPAESVLAVVAEFGADLQAAAKNAIDAIRETAATSQESYALAPPPVHTHGPHDGVGLSCPEEQAESGLMGACRQAEGMNQRLPAWARPVIFGSASRAIDPETLGLGAVVWASVYRPDRGTVRIVLVKSPRSSGLPWICEDAAFRSSQLARVEVLHPGIEVPS